MGKGPDWWNRLYFFCGFYLRSDMTENLQSGLGVFREGRKLENKMVPVFSEEHLGFGKMIPGTSQQGRKQMVTS